MQGTMYDAGKGEEKKNDGEKAKIGEEKKRKQLQGLITRGMV